MAEIAGHPPGKKMEHICSKILSYFGLLFPGKVVSDDQKALTPNGVRFEQLRAVLLPLPLTEPVGQRDNRQAVY